MDTIFTMPPFSGKSLSFNEAQGVAGNHQFLIGWYDKQLYRSVFLDESAFLRRLT